MEIKKQWIVEYFGKFRQLVLTYKNGYFIHQKWGYMSLIKKEAEELILKL